MGCSHVSAGSGFLLAFSYTKKDLDSYVTFASIYVSVKSVFLIVLF